MTLDFYNNCHQQQLVVERIILCTINDRIIQRRYRLYGLQLLVAFAIISLSSFKTEQFATAFVHNSFPVIIHQSKYHQLKKRRYTPMTLLHLSDRNNFTGTSVFYSHNHHHHHNDMEQQFKEPIVSPTNNPTSTTAAGATFTSEEYIDIIHSSNILRIFLFHATMYYTLAVLGFSYFVESWSIVDSLYYATTLFCTIGFGDIAPGNIKAQLYTIFMALYGITFLGILLGAVTDYCFEYQNYQANKRCDAVSSQILHQLKSIEASKQSWNKNVDTFGRGATSQTLNAKQSSIVSETSAQESKLWNDNLSHLLQVEGPVILLFITIAIIIGHYYEGWTIFESIYWFVISGATIGFGDYTPQLPMIKLFCVLYLPCSVAIFGNLLRRIISFYIDRKRQKAEEQFLARSLSLSDLNVMDTDNNGRVDKAEFLAYMLCTLQKVSKEEVADIIDLFHKLDVDHDNYLTKKDLIDNEWENSIRTSLKQSMEQSMTSSLL